MKNVNVINLVFISFSTVQIYDLSYSHLHSSWVRIPFRALISQLLTLCVLLTLKYVVCQSCLHGATVLETHRGISFLNNQIYRILITQKFD